MDLATPDRYQTGWTTMVTFLISEKALAVAARTLSSCVPALKSSKVIRLVADRNETHSLPFIEYSKTVRSESLKSIVENSRVNELSRFASWNTSAWVTAVSMMSNRPDFMPRVTGLSWI